VRNGTYWLRLLTPSLAPSSLAYMPCDISILRRQPVSQNRLYGKCGLLSHFEDHRLGVASARCSSHQTDNQLEGWEKSLNRRNGSNFFISSLILLTNASLS
jgi:hypothetical protein